MSILADEPNHFLDWLTQRHNFEGHHFVPRRIYGDYVEASLDDAATASDRVSISWIVGSAVSLSANHAGIAIKLASGESLDGTIAVLAVGNSPPMSPACFASLRPDRYKSNAWASDAPLKIGSSATVLVVGTGLTAIDQILKLSLEEHAGTVYVLSRRGKLPALHSPSPAWPSDWTTNLPSDIRSIFREVRRQVRLATAAGSDWRAVIDSLRLATPKIWQSLSPDDKRRFVRHVRPYWEVARHRIPASTYNELQRLMSEGRMVLLSGRIGEAIERDVYVEVTYTDRDSSEARTLRVDRVINCTGPGTVNRVQDELLASLLDHDLARLDCLGLGIETGDFGAVINAAGQASESVFAIGPVRKASLWESTAVPEIRAQAKELAAVIEARLTAN